MFSIGRASEGLKATPHWGQLISAKVHRVSQRVYCMYRLRLPTSLNETTRLQASSTDLATVVGSGKLTKQSGKDEPNAGR